MAFKPITDQEGDSNDKDLPWANVWRKSNLDTAADPRTVHTVRVYDTGIMVTTFEYKAYLHVGTQQYADLLEAVQVWVKEKSYGTPLLCSVNKAGKPILGLDEDQPKAYWHCTENLYVQVSKRPLEEQKKGKAVNPLLAGRGVPDTTPVREDVTSTSPASDVPVEASGRAKKAR